MSPNKRILLNVFATYGRSLYALVCGLFTSRWVLMALGQEDFGLYGVIGGLVVFIGFINGLLGLAVSRFYAVGVGLANVSSDRSAAVETRRQWFSSAIIAHTFVPVILVFIGWPLGEYAIREGLIVVPFACLSACLWTFRFACIACFVSMVTIPFSAMYTAKQYIAELTIYSFATTTCNMVFFYYMVTHPGVWLTRYAAWMAAIVIVPAVTIAFRAYLIFPECRFAAEGVWNADRIKRLMAFAGWQAFGSLGALFRTQGIAILLNRRPSFGPMRNSSMSVATQLAGQTEALASSMVGAFQPAIANAWGARDYKKARLLAYQTCKIGTLLSMVFIIPLSLELPTVLHIWLKNPPIYAAGLKDVNAQHSDYWFRFVNAVAKEIAKSHPDKKISTLAYSSHSGMPSFRLEPNIIVHFCFTCNRIPYAKKSAIEVQQLRDWRTAYPKQPFGLWLYNTFPKERADRVTHVNCFPGFFAHVLKNEYALLGRRNISENIYNCGFVDDYENFLSLRWMWNPCEALEALEEDYFSSYGAAAAPLKEFYRIIEECYCGKGNYPVDWVATKAHQTAEIAWGVLGTDDVMRRLGTLMNEAERIADTPLAKARVANWKYGVWDYMREGSVVYKMRRI